MKYLIKGAKVVNEGQSVFQDVLISNGIIAKVGNDISDPNAEVIDAEGMLLIPGMIDDQVHFREPGLTHKADIQTESRAAAAGGITSFMEMPNTVPNTLTQELLEDKYQIAAKNAAVNYSFFMGASNENIEEVLKTNPKNVCGVKVFMGSSTGNMLVDNEKVLSSIFKDVPMLIATHCEDEATIRANIEKAKATYGENVPFTEHPIIRSREACYTSSSFAVSLAKKYNSRLHILHISSKEECDLFDNSIPLEQKRITAEACVHHLWFTDKQYSEKGSLIKWNPAVKSFEDREEIRKAVNDNRIDIIATDHAPHTSEEKSGSYFNAPSGGPLVQHALLSLLEMCEQNVFTLEKIVQKTAHNPAILFNIEKRGFIREGYFADIVLVKPKNYTVTKSNILYKCGWSPFEGQSFQNSIEYTFVNGEIAYHNGELKNLNAGSRLTFKA
jgi:dihydroorotase